jgi:nitrate/nitrite-specific signal transduction histidine kinase
MEQTTIQLIVMITVIVALIIYLMIIVGLMSSQVQKHSDVIEDVGNLRTSVKAKYNIA